MKRYHDEKRINEKRAKLRKRLNESIGGPAGHEPDTGRFRKSLRCGGCGRARCQVCHPEKFPKRERTRQEKKAQLKEKEQE